MHTQHYDVGWLETLPSYLSRRGEPVSEGAVEPDLVAESDEDAPAWEEDAQTFIIRCGCSF